MTVIFFINVAEWALIAIIGLCGTLAFASSGAYSGLHNYLLSHYPEIGKYLIAIVWGFLAMVGIVSITFRRKGGGRFTWLALIFAMPSILAFNKLDIPGLLGLKIELTTGLAFWQVMVLTLGIMAAYLLLNFMRELKLFRLLLGKKGADPADIDNVSVKSHQLLLASLLSAVVLTAAVSLISVNLESFLLPYFSRLPWNIVFIGAGCLLIMAVFIYWLGIHLSSSDK
jgi:hypothetical protein